MLVSLNEQPVLLLDGQTTGMQPTRGQLLELAWMRWPEPALVESRLLKLPEGESVPPRISQLTGVWDDDMVNAVEEEAVVLELEEMIGDSNPVVVIHYATFERSFLNDLWLRHRGKPFPWKIVCTHKIAERLFPQLPSRNIRAVAGSFGHTTGEFKRAGPHVQATATIWRGLCAEFDQRGIKTFEELDALVAQKKPKGAKYEYRVDRLKRLELPDQPGVYRMLSKSGEILYVGKATSLRDRVNSYFRGKKGRERRKLELMAQVWDLRVTVCETPLEAALLESDEIKCWNPPYNVSLKTGRRSLLFYHRGFTSASSQQSEEHPLGPFRPMNFIESMRLLQQSWSAKEFKAIFFEDIDLDLLREGFELFLRRNGIDGEKLTSVRSFFAVAMKMYRAQLRDEETEAEEEEDEGLEGEDVEVEYTAQDISEKYERLFVRAAAEIRRARKLTRLLNARITWTWKNRQHELEFRRGRRGTVDASDSKWPWRGLGIADYDRISIVNSEVSKASSRARVTPLV